MTTIPSNERVFAVMSRISTRTQLKGHSLKDQKEHGEKYARTAGASRVVHYSAVESATKVERECLDQVLEDARRGCFSVLVVQELSRLSRHPGITFLAMQQLTDAGVELHTWTGPVEYETPTDELYVMMQSAVHRFAARVSVDKSVAARLGLMKGGSIAAGRPPAGREWNRLSRKFELVEAQAARIRSAYKLLVEHGRSFNTTAKAVGMAPSSLRKALLMAGSTQVTQHLKGQEFTFPCPAILSEGEMGQLHATLAANKVTRPSTKSEYLLQGLVLCQHCKCTLTGQTSTKSGKRYSVYRHPPAKYEDGCTWQIPARLLEEAIFSACVQLIEDSGTLRQAIQSAMTEEEVKASQFQERIREIEKDTHAARSRIDRALELLLNLEREGEGKKRLLDRIKRDEELVNALQIERLDLEERIPIIQPNSKNLELIVAQIKTLFWRGGVLAMAQLPFERRRELVRAIVGRSGRNSEEAIYIAKRGSKKKMYWKYILKGRFAVSESFLEPNEVHGQDIQWREMPTNEIVKRLASVARSARPLRLPVHAFDLEISRKWAPEKHLLSVCPPNRSVQIHSKCSSNG